MGRTTIAGLGIAAALLAAVPARASSMVDISGALATDSAASSTSGMGAASTLGRVKGALQHSIPTFTPPKIEVDAPTQGAAKTPQASGPTATSRPGSPSAPSVHGSSGGSSSGTMGSWRIGSSKAASTVKTGWAAGAKGDSSGKRSGGQQCWATASAGGHGTSAASAWKTGHSGGAH
jgi:hypothetical protein